MRPTLRSEIFDLPSVLREIFEGRRREYDATLRRTLSSETDLVFAGTTATLALAEYMAAAFTSLLGWPCTARNLAEFEADNSWNFRPGCVFFLIPEEADSAELLKFVARIRSQKGLVLALVEDPDCALTQQADEIFVVGRGALPGKVTFPVSRQAVAGFLALLVARAVKRLNPRLETLDKEFRQLPGHLGRIFLQHGDGVRSFAREICRARNPVVVGEGSYHYSSIQGAEMLSRFAGITARSGRASELLRGQEAGVWKDTPLLILSGSRCMGKEGIRSTVKSANRVGAAVFSITDGNDAEVCRHSKMTLLVPALEEITGSLLVHVTVAWLAYEASRLRLVDRAQ